MSKRKTKDVDLFAEARKLLDEWDEELRRDFDSAYAYAYAAGGSERLVQ